MRVLLLGGNGFVGSHLRARLERDGHSLGYITRTGVTTVKGLGFCDAIINCAGQLDDSDQMVADNLTLVEWMLRLSRQGGCRFIQIGSSAETGPMEGPRSESSFCDPSNLYEATKLAATNLCLGYAAQYGTDVVIARPFSLYGSNDKTRKLLPTLWRTWVDGKVFRCHLGGHDWLHIDDFVEGIITLLHAPRSVTRGQVYHFGTGINTSNAEIVRLFNRSVGGAGVNVEYVQYLYHPHDVMDWRANTTKTEDRLGWRSKVTVGEGIYRFVDTIWFGRPKEA